MRSTFSIEKVNYPKNCVSGKTQCFTMLRLKHFFHRNREARDALLNAPSFMCFQIYTWRIAFIENKAVTDIVMWDDLDKIYTFSCREDQLTNRVLETAVQVR